MDGYRTTPVSEQIFAPFSATQPRSLETPPDRPSKCSERDQFRTARDCCGVRTVPGSPDTPVRRVERCHGNPELVCIPMTEKPGMNGHILPPRSEAFPPGAVDRPSPGRQHRSSDGEVLGAAQPQVVHCPMRPRLNCHARLVPRTLHRQAALRYGGSHRCPSGPNTIRVLAPHPPHSRPVWLERDTPRQLRERTDPRMLLHHLTKRHGLYRRSLTKFQPPDV